MARRRDKLLAEVRKYFGFKNIKSWEGYNKSLSLDKNWDGAIEEYRRREARRERSARRIQEAWRENGAPKRRIDNLIDITFESYIPAIAVRPEEPSGHCLL